MVKGLVTGPDGGDLFVASAEDAYPVRAGGVAGMPAGIDVTVAPFGFVELVVWSGVGAGAVHRLEVGHHVCGPGDDVDIPLPLPAPVEVEVSCGGEVVLDGISWPVGQRRVVGGLDLLLRWCSPPSSGSGRPVQGLPLADLLLDRIDGRVSPEADPAWELGRPPGGTEGERVAPAVAESPLLTVAGAHRHAASRAVLARLLTTSGADRVRLTVLAPGTGEAGRGRWAWARWVPHARTGDERVVRVGFDDAACSRLVAEIAAADDGLLDVVVVDGGVGDPPRVARPGLAVLVLTDTTPASPPAGVFLDAAGPRSRVWGVGAAAEGSAIDVDLPDVGWMDRLARTMATFEHSTPAPGRLADLLGSAPGDLAAYAANWARPPTTRVPIGRSIDDGSPVSVDLRTDGPHALIGGTTGSGKSELLLTLVAGLAALNPPEAMSFLLVDYKGGAAFGDCMGLPHTVGVVTDLDSASTARALASLTAEVHRRERLLAEAGAADLDAFLAAGRGPLARLVIVVDEFATLAAELPDFVDGLVDIARRGRSLGLHLVLATQRPAGAVSADIRANTTLRISLRVAEAADSVDVIGVPDAVTIGEREPGRALVRVGRSAPVSVQTARVTTSVHADVAAPYSFGLPLAAAGDRSDLAVMAGAMSVSAADRGVALPVRPWLPPLPVHLELGELDDAPDDPDLVPFGLEDRPADQRREVAALRLDEGVPLAVIGGARSGRTGVLTAIAASVADRFTPAQVHVYGVDAGTRGLGVLEGLPHVGAVVFRDEPDRLERLVARLCDELDRRVQAAALHGLPGNAGEGEPAWPSVVLLVDRWDLVIDAAEAGDDRGIVSGLERLASEGGRVGIAVVATGDRGMLTGRMTSLFPDRLVLRLADVYDYVALGTAGPAGHGEPGRGWRGVECVETQVAAVGPEDLAAAGRAAGRSADGLPFRIDAVPRVVTREDVAALPCDRPVPEGALLVAVGGDELAPRWIDVDEYGPCALVTGRRRSGRSGVLLTLAESALAAEGRPWEVVLVTARRSPLSVLAEVSDRVHGPWRDDEDAASVESAVEAVLGRGHRVLVLADDIDLLPDGELQDALGRLPARLRDTSSLFVGSGEAEEIVAAFRGPASLLRRARCGVMLSPHGTEDGDAFGVRMRRGQLGRSLGAGGGFLVLDGPAERVQVIRSGLLPDPSR